MSILMSKVNNLIEDLNKKIGSYLDTKDSILENDYFQLLGDSSRVVGALMKVSELASRKKFEEFLKGFHNIDNPTEEQLAKLIKYIDNEQKAEFIANIFQKILLAKSSKSCLIMGYITQDIIENKDELTLKDLICLDALTNFFDFDIVYFKYICDCGLKEQKRASKGRTHKSKQLPLSIKFRFNNYFYGKWNKDGISIASVALTVEKAVAHQLLEKEVVVELDIDSDDVSLSGAENDVYYTLTDPGSKLYEYILKISQVE